MQAWFDSWDIWMQLPATNSTIVIATMFLYLTFPRSRK